MEIMCGVHALRMAFTLPAGPDKVLTRWVNGFIICGAGVWLVDAGLAGARTVIGGYLKQIGRKASDVSMLILTHAHPDHIGGARGVQQLTGCRIAAHQAEVAWIENVERQAKERPVPGFAGLVEGGVGVDLALHGGERFTMSGVGDWVVVPTPGHSSGHIALHGRDDGVLICGDAVPVPGQMPIYEDAVAAMRSLKRIREIRRLRVLLSAWDEPRFGDAAYTAMDAGMNYMQTIHRAVLEARARGGEDLPAVTRQVAEMLGWGEVAINPLVMRTMAAHLKAAGGWADLREV